MRALSKPKIVRSMRWLATVTALWLCGPPSALAQSQDWLVLPTTADDDEIEWMQPTVDMLTGELRRQGVGVWRSDRAVAEFERRGSAPASELSDAEVRAWAERSQEALRKLSMAQTQAALAELEDTQAFSREFVETLNREPGGAQAVLDTCLYLVRARAAAGDEVAAAEQAEECVRIVPSGKPSARMHPPEILNLYETAASPGPKRTGTLRVESDPSQCPIRLNGVRVGRTPAELPGLYPGEYRVQLECEPEGSRRMHTVEVPTGGASLFVFDEFDQAVRTVPFLHLKYETMPDHPQRAADARQFGRALPAPAVLLASRTVEDVLDLRVVSTAQVETTLVRISTTQGGPTEPEITEAVTALLAGQCRDFAGEEPVRIDCLSGAPMPVVDGALSAKDTSRSRRRPPRPQFVSGVTLLSLGTASMLAGYSLSITRRLAGDDWLDAPNSLAAQDKWLGLGTGLLATGATGASLLVAGMPLALPYKPKTPWWAWLSGGLGVAAAVGAIASGATADPKPPQSCSLSGPDPAACVARHRDTDRAFILGMTAAPLLTMPLVYLLRRDARERRSELAPVLSAGRQGARVGIRGAF